jgi:cytidine deaminase
MMGNQDAQAVMSDEELVEVAKEARQAAHAPYSNFQVGAALLTSDGRVFKGCNIENSVYSLTMCAERVAVFKAVSEGARGFVKIAIVADSEKITPPCGCCRQMVWEFGNDQTRIILSNLDGDVRKFEIKELFPLAFDASFLEGIRDKKEAEAEV